MKVIKQNPKLMRKQNKITFVPIEKAGMKEIKESLCNLMTDVNNVIKDQCHIKLLLEHHSQRQTFFEQYLMKLSCENGKIMSSLSISRR